MRRRSSPRVGTIGGLARQHRPLFVTCKRCGHEVRLRAANLSRQHGGELPLQRFLERAVCTACGARWPDIDCIALLDVQPVDRPADRSRRH